MGGFEVRASPATTQAWRVLRRKRAAWRVLASVAWFVHFVAALVLGDSPGPVDLPQGTIRGGETQLTAGVVVAKLRGWPARREEFVARSLAVRLRGPAATMRGRLYVSDRDMVWIPDREWRAIDARDLLLRLDEIARAELASLRRSTGLTLFTTDGSEVWLWLGRRVDDLDRWVSG